MLVDVPELSSFFFLLSGAEETGGFLGISLLKLKKQPDRGGLIRASVNWQQISHRGRLF
jgi:hypothetical protein